MGVFDIPKPHLQARAPACLASGSLPVRLKAALGWGFLEFSQAHLGARCEWCCLIFTISLRGEALVQWGVGFQPSPAALLESHSSSGE